MRFAPEAEATLHDIMRWRRDVRHFLPDPVMAEDMSQLSAAMELAPSVGNSRPWRVMRVRQPALREKITELYERCNAEAANAYSGEQRQAYLALKLAGLREAPEHLAVFTVLDPAQGHGLGRRTMPDTLDYSSAMAIHALWLAARARNLGVGWVSILDEAKACAILDAEPTWRLTAYLCLGHPAFVADLPLLHNQGWQENTPHPWIER
ncbi:MAG: 5,6-dimethylbenzimidazole synthase [Bosea sp. (in: a-proteobacteria)]